MNKSTLIFIGSICTVIALFLLFNKRTIKKQDTTVLIVGTNAEYPPFSFIRNDEIVGFDIDIITEIANRLGKKLELHDMPFDALLPKLQLGYIQCIAAGITATPARSKNILFTKPYLKNDPLLIISLGSQEPIRNMLDLFGKAVVVNEGYTADAYVSAIPEVNIKRLATSTEAFLSLKIGSVAAFVAAQSSVEPFFAKHAKADFHIVPIEGVSDNYALAISKHHADLFEPIQKALDDMERDGTLDKFKKKWNIQ